MAKVSKINFDLKGLEAMRAGLGDTYRARVGILGSHAARSDSGPLDNATLGLIQIFGSLTKNIPPRDFLMMPIEFKRRDIVQAMGSSMMKKAIEAGDFKLCYELLGAAGVAAVIEAFETSGFGQWPPNAPATIARKKSDRPLIDTSQLRRAQTSDVVKKGEIDG